MKGNLIEKYDVIASCTPPPLKKNIKQLKKRSPRYIFLH